MRRLALASVLGFLALSVYGIATAAGYRNATIAGPFACLGSGYAKIKDAKGASTWVPSTSVGQATNDGSGAFTGISTSNTAGVACSSKFKGTGTINPDGTGAATVNFSPIASNPAQCPSSATVHSVSVIESPNSFYVLSTDPDFTGWLLCTRQTQ